MTDVGPTAISADRRLCVLLTPVRSYASIYLAIASVCLVVGVAQQRWEPFVLCTVVSVAAALLEVLALWSGPRRSAVDVDENTVTVTSRGHSESWPVDHVRRVHVIEQKPPTVVVRVEFVNGRHRDVRILVDPRGGVEGRIGASR
jgi:hypothetical protein